MAPAAEDALFKENKQAVDVNNAVSTFRAPPEEALLVEKVHFEIVALDDTTLSAPPKPETAMLPLIVLEIMLRMEEPATYTPPPSNDADEVDTVHKFMVRDAWPAR